MSDRFRLYPTSGQEELLSSHCADARYVWNLALEQFNCYRRPLGAPPGPAERSRQLTDARDGTWLGEGARSVQEQALRDFDRAVRDWHNGTHRRPRWRSAKGQQGIGFQDAAVWRLNGKWAEVAVPKAGRIKFRLTRDLPFVGRKSVARITRSVDGRWHISFPSPQRPVNREVMGSVVGVDRGVTETLATSDGGLLRIPPPSAKQQERRLRLERKLARQTKGSKRRERTRLGLARCRSREQRQRKDWIEKTTTDFVRGYDVVVLEDLNVRNMTRSARGTVQAPGVNVRQKSALNREVRARAWSLFARRLGDKAEASGVQVVKVNPAFTSQTCAVCGTIDARNRESQAFRCVACGHEAHADVNAAKNILARGTAAGSAVAGRGDSGLPGSVKRQPVLSARP